MRKWNPGFYSMFDTNYYASVLNAIPTTDGGYKTVRQCSPFTSGTTTFAGGAIAAYVFQKVDGTARLFAATATRINELTGAATWTDRSKGGAAYTTVLTGWTATQYGDSTIYASIENAIQVSSTAAAFADLAGSPPKAKIVLSQTLAVGLFNYNDGVNTYPDGWWFSDIGASTTWTPGAANQAANGRLLQTPGPITAAIPFKNEVIAFKANAMYRMTYVGRPAIWQVQLFDKQIGCSSQSAVLDIGGALLFSNRRGFYLYDGNTVTRISDGGKNVSLATTGTELNLGCFYDEFTDVAYFGFGLCYNRQADAFGRWQLISANGADTLRTIVRGTTEAYNTNVAGVGLLLAPAFFRASTTNSELVTMTNECGGLTSIAGTMNLISNIHGKFQSVTNWNRFIPIMRHDPVYFSGSFVMTVGTNQRVGGTGVAVALTGTELNMGFTYDPLELPRADRVASGRFAQVNANYGFSSANLAAVGTTVYDYIFEPEKFAGTN